jgi:hypothetical protein
MNSNEEGGHGPVSFILVEKGLPWYSQKIMKPDSFSLKKVLCTPG